MSENVVYVGMDLGSFKTSVSCSNGKRATLASAVGWPKDHIARAVIGRDVAFGADLEANPLAVEVLRPFHMGALKYTDADRAGIPADRVQVHRRAAELLVRHAVSLVAEPGGQVFGVIGAPSRATLDAKQVILNAARAAFDAVMIVPEPFAVAYGMQRLTNTLVIDIGAGTIDLCPMYGAYPADDDQVTIPLGGDHIDQRFAELVEQTLPEVHISRRVLREIKEKYGSAREGDERAIVTLPVAGRLRQVDLTEQLSAACQAVAPVIAEGVKKLVSRFEFDMQRVLLGNIVLAGGGGQLRGLDRALEASFEELGGASVVKVYDSVFAGATGALGLAMALPADKWRHLRSDREDGAKAA